MTRQKEIEKILIDFHSSVETRYHNAGTRNFRPEDLKKHTDEVMELVEKERNNFMSDKKLYGEVVQELSECKAENERLRNGCRNDIEQCAFILENEELKAELDRAKELTPEKLHQLYLDATVFLNPDSYNPQAQKQYSDLTEEQKSIDIYICDAIKKLIGGGDKSNKIKNAMKLQAKCFEPEPRSMEEIDKELEEE